MIPLRYKKKKKSFDLVFIDAQHTFNECLADIKHWVTMMKPGSILAGHDFSINHLETMLAVIIGLVEEGFTELNVGMDNTWWATVPDLD